ncbi:unnamed protein product [Albugo candida]|uniref:Uncharacterized protein n=1 Tax=Albugo candida TaxID=65357 RepID=A0A024GQX2_9STRA|nr:unnamed protein product [Albugo candida]|eukprot:CCI48763.1 unnamed protein product [Albugo candida]
MARSASAGRIKLDVASHMDEAMKSHYLCLMYLIRPEGSLCISAVVNYIVDRSLCFAERNRCYVVFILIRMTLHLSLSPRNSLSFSICNSLRFHLSQTNISRDS